MSGSSGHKGSPGLKEKLLHGGLEAFEPHETIELLLSYSLPKANVSAVAHALYKKFGSVANILEASQEELLSVDGMSRESVIMLAFFRELSKEYLKQGVKVGDNMSDTNKIGEFFAAKFFGEKEEVVYALCLDSDMNFISCAEISRGSTTDNEFSSRRLAEIVIREGASNVVIAHNHPAGIAAPSKPDTEMTKYTCQRLSAIGITLTDHIIVGQNNKFVSLKERGIVNTVSENIFIM